MISLISIKLQGRDLGRSRFGRPSCPGLGPGRPKCFARDLGGPDVRPVEFQARSKNGARHIWFLEGCRLFWYWVSLSVPFSKSLITCYSATTIAIIIGILCPLLFILTYILRLPETTKPPWMFLLLDRAFKCWIGHIIVGLLYVIFRFFTRMF